MMTMSTRVAASSYSSSLAKSTTKSSSRARSTGYPPKAFLSKTTNKTTTTREKDYNSGKKKSRYEVTSCSSSRSSRGTDDNDDGIEEKARSFSSSSSSPTTTTTKLSRRSALFFSSFVAGSGGFAPFASEVETEAKAALAGEQLIDSRTFVSRAMQKFERNDVEGATLDFDALIAKSPGSKPYLWQRGIALYYIDEFREAEKQFREDVKVNPNDTEEAAWAFLSQMRKGGEGDVSSTLNKAREEFVELAGRDSRKVMGSVLRLYKTGDEEAKKTLESLSKKPADSTQSASDAFYASLYLGLYSEAIGNAEEAKYWMKKANGTPYGQRASGDFMTSVARVHLARRKWDTIDEDSSDRTRPTGGNVEVVSTHAFDSATRRLERFPFPESFSMRIV